MHSVIAFSLRGSSQGSSLLHLHLRPQARVFCRAFSDVVLPRASGIVCYLGYSVIRSCLLSSLIAFLHRFLVIGCSLLTSSLGFSMKGFSLGYAVIWSSVGPSLECAMINSSPLSSMISSAVVMSCLGPLLIWSSRAQ